MAITPTYSWPLPDDDDLVKDGAEAIRDLGNAIDTTVDGLGIGLVHIETVSFTTSSSESFNDVFSSSYDFYRILMTVTGSTTITGLRYRLRVAGSDASGANYNRQLLEGSDSSAIANRETGETSGPIGALINTGPNLITADIVNPFITNRTVVNSMAFDPRVVIAHFGSEHTLSTSYTGMTIFPQTGTMTGSFSIYGYAKA
jgi:hypothetical protein